MKKLFIALLTLMSVQLTGCMTYSQNKVADAHAWPLQQAEKKSIYLKVEGISTVNGQPAQIGVNVPKLEQLLVKEYESSQAFSRVSVKQQSSDLYVRTSLANNENSNMALAFLCGFTFFVVPAYGENDFVLETRFVDTDGNEVAKITKRESTTTWLHLVLIFGMPFSESTDAVVAKMVRNTLEEAQQRKLI